MRNDFVRMYVARKRYMSPGAKVPLPCGSPSKIICTRCTGVSHPNGILIGLAVFTQLTRVSNTQTHRPRCRPTSVAIGRIISICVLYIYKRILMTLYGGLAAAVQQRHLNNIHFYYYYYYYYYCKCVGDEA